MAVCNLSEEAAPKSGGQLQERDAASSTRNVRAFLLIYTAAEQTAQILVLTQLLKKLPTLNNLSLEFRGSTTEFFKEVSKAIPKKMLNRLRLSHISTRFKYFSIFHGSCGTELHHLTLEDVSLSGDNDQYALFEYLQCLELRSYVLKRLNIDGQGLRFGKINKIQGQPPVTGAVAPRRLQGSENELVLSSEKEDDASEGLREWWRCDLGLPWPRHI